MLDPITDAELQLTSMPSLPLTIKSEPIPEGPTRKSCDDPALGNIAPSRPCDRELFDVASPQADPEA